MKSIKIPLLSMLLLAVLIHPALSAESVNIGIIKLTIGDPERETRQKLQEGKYLIAPYPGTLESDNLIVICNESGRELGSVKFKDGKVFSVEKETRNEETPMILAELFDILYKYSQNGEKPIVSAIKKSNYEGVNSEYIVFYLSKTHSILVEIKTSKYFKSFTKLTEAIY